MITARAHSNIALIKYWGKRDTTLNLPAVGSISMTLDGLHTTTSLRPDESLQQDRFLLNGQPAGKQETARLRQFLDLARGLAGKDAKFHVESRNNFPTAAGLASSASGFAALALAATRALDVQLTPAELSALARRGSGSAARSLFGGFVEMKRGQNPDGSDSYAEQIAPRDYWDVRLIIAITSRQQKETGSTKGMELSRATSPYYPAWVDSSPADLREMRAAILNRDFQKAGELSEFSCLKMHALALSANPGIIYWNGATVEAMHRIRQLRKSGLPVYFTIDAGPQIKALCLPQAAARVIEALRTINGIKECIETRPGDDAYLIEKE